MFGQMHCLVSRSANTFLVYIGTKAADYLHRILGPGELAQYLWCLAVASGRPFPCSMACPGRTAGLVGDEENAICRMACDLGAVYLHRLSLDLIVANCRYHKI